MADPLGILRALAYPAHEASGGIAGLFQGQLEGEQLRRKFTREDLENALLDLQLKGAGAERFLGQGDGSLIYQKPGGPIQTRPLTPGDTTESHLMRGGWIIPALQLRYDVQKRAGRHEEAEATLAEIQKLTAGAHQPSYTRERLGLIAQGALHDPAISAEQAKTRLEEDEARDIRIAGGKSESTARGREKVTGEAFTPDAIELAAQTYLITRQLPPIGMGGVTARGKILSRAAQIAQEAGITLSDVPERQATFHAAQLELNRVRGQAGLVLSFARTADSNLDIALDLSEKVSRTGAPVLNTWILSGRRALGGDPLVSQFNAAVQVAINETARVTSGQSSGPSTDTARREIEHMLNTAQTPEQFRAVVAVLKRDMANRRAGYDTQVRELQDLLRELGRRNLPAQKPDVSAPSPARPAGAAAPRPAAPAAATASPSKQAVPRVLTEPSYVRRGVQVYEGRAGQQLGSTDELLGSVADYQAGKYTIPDYATK